ncbi:MAG: hypothetical protein A3I00_04485 [Betaproteobacteria bacterium RIFCSPLOWO2_02_FULL_64_12]|nr:MAG: hypothetical protein A3I00_04485 [Betaproteobacteria bacterium RIFCSPLOWO2_02_FULL_64_12]
MKPRGQRLACAFKTVDGCVGACDAYPGEAPKSIAKVDPVKWDREPQKDVLEAHFTVIGEMGMTGHIIRLNQYQWRALAQTKLQDPFFAAILWGGNPLKVVEDAQLLAKRISP